MFVMLYEATVGVLSSVPSETADATSLHAVAVWLSTTGSGLIETVTVNGLPSQPLSASGVNV